MERGQATKGLRCPVTACLLSSRGPLERPKTGADRAPGQRSGGARYVVNSARMNTDVEITREHCGVKQIPCTATKLRPPNSPAVARDRRPLLGLPRLPGCC